jgi:hypothetical protein
MQNKCSLAGLWVCEREACQAAESERSLALATSPWARAREQSRVVWGLFRAKMVAGRLCGHKEHMESE